MFYSSSKRIRIICEYFKHIFHVTKRRKELFKMAGLNNLMAKNATQLILEYGPCDLKAVPLIGQV